MNRRQVLAGSAALAVGGVALSAQGEKTLAEIDLEDKYWQNQWLISELEQELSEMRAHARIMKNASVV